MKLILLSLYLVGNCLAQPKITLDATVQPPVDVQPEAGDRVTVDPSTGDIVASSNGVTFKIPNFRKQVAASIDAAVEQSGSIYTYRYSVRNDAAAKLAIQGLIFQVLDAKDVTEVAPGGWFSLRSATPSPAAPGVLFSKNPTDVRGRLTANRAELFILRSERLPGIIQCRVLPSDEFPTSNQMSYGEFLDRASPWVREKLMRTDTRDRHILDSFIVGPKVRKGEDSIGAIQSEFRLALGIPGLAGAARQFQGSPSQTKAELLQSINGISMTTPTQLVFVDGIRARLSALP